MPFGITFATYLLKLLVLCFIPETAPHRSWVSAEPSSLELREMSDGELHCNLLEQDMAMLQDGRHISIFDQLRGLLKTQVPTIGRLTHISGVKMVFLSFAAKRIGFASLAFIFQYASEILHIQMSKTILLRIVHQSFITALFFFILPMLTKASTSPTKDVWVIRCSLIVLSLGFSIIWSGHQLSVLSIGMEKSHEKAISSHSSRLGDLRAWRRARSRPTITWLIPCW